VSPDLSYEVRLSAREVLPTICEETLNKLMQKLDANGIESLDDCHLLNELDLADVLKPVQIRKLLAHWKTGNKHKTFGIIECMQIRQLANKAKCRRC
jgi:hypothetical protein